MGELGTAELAAAVRIRRRELGLTRADVTAAGGPPVATQTAIEAGNFTPAAEVLETIDTGLNWPPGTAHKALTNPPSCQQLTTPTTLEQHRQIYRELSELGASPATLEHAGHMLEQPLRLAIRHAVATADLQTLLTIDDLLTGTRTPNPRLTTPGTRTQRGKRQRNAAPEISTDAGFTALRDVRLNQGLSLRDVCAKLNALRYANGDRRPVSPGTLSAIETGTRGMSLEMAGMLEQAYGLPRAALSGYVRRRERKRNRETASKAKGATPDSDSPDPTT